VVPWEGKDEVDCFICAVEKANSCEFPKDSQGRLLHCRDADRLVFSLVLTSKIVNMAGKGHK